MPRFKLKGVLERSAVRDLWKQTLSRIPTVYGRLAYLASLRDSASGVYRHHGLTAAFGRDESAKALRLSHEQTFQEWISLPLSEKSEDLQTYLKSLEDSSSIVVEHLLVSRAFRAQAPATARPVEMELFVSELEALLAVMKHALIVEGSDPRS